MLRVGEVIVVDFPHDQPLFGWEEELKMRVGSTVEVIKIDKEPLVRSKFSLKVTGETDCQRVEDGLLDFKNRHPGTQVTSWGVNLKAS